MKSHQPILEHGCRVTELPLVIQGLAAAQEIDEFVGYPRQPSAFVGQTVMPGYRNNLAFHPTKGLTPQSEMSESDDQQPLRTEEGPRAHACEPRADANNQNEFAVPLTVNR